MRNFKPPPILSKRIANPTFPLSVTLDSDVDSTEEGVALAGKWKAPVTIGGKERPPLPLLVGARLDSDGVAATRSPEDLTGQTSVEWGDGRWGTLDVVLEGRGLTGKFITQQR